MSAVVEESNSPQQAPDEGLSASISALHDNIAKKGRNAYYFAHSNTPKGPEWDGKPEPRLLEKKASSDALTSSKKSSFDYTKSNITSYAFSDSEKSVKLYIEKSGIGGDEACTEENIVLDYTPESLSLQIRDKCLVFGKLTGLISSATYQLKEEHLVLVLKKQSPGEVWHTVNDKGTADHEVV